MFVQLLIFVLSIQQIVLAKSNYCDRSLCNGNHVGCNNNGRFAYNCQLKSVKLEDISHLKDKIVDKHNEIRNKVASGQFGSYKPASRMATMQWDDELAYLAELNLKKCQPGHDCHNTKEFKFSGQNIGFIANSIDNGLEINVDEMINSWYDEHVNANNNIIKKFRSSNSELVYGHFTVMVADRNYKVGCAVIKYITSGMTAYSMTCNYAFTNMLNQPIYEFGRPGEGCKTGTNPKYPALCSTAEKYNV